MFLGIGLDFSSKPAETEALASIASAQWIFMCGTVPMPAGASLPSNGAIVDSAFNTTALTSKYPPFKRLMRISSKAPIPRYPPFSLTSDLPDWLLLPMLNVGYQDASKLSFLFVTRGDPKSLTIQMPREHVRLPIKHLTACPCVPTAKLRPYMR